MSKIVIALICFAFASYIIMAFVMEMRYIVNNDPPCVPPSCVHMYIPVHANFQTQAILIGCCSFICSILWIQAHIWQFTLHTLTFTQSS